MPPKESDHLLLYSGSSPESSNKKYDLLPRITHHQHMSFDDGAVTTTNAQRRRRKSRLALVAVVAAMALGVALWSHHRMTTTTLRKHRGQARTGPYQLSQRQVGADFASYYDFYAGKDSLGSAGYNMYVSYDRAVDQGLFRVVTEDDKDKHDDHSSSSSSSSAVYLSTQPTKEGPRESIRLEGKQRFDTGGLFILNVDHMPYGCGQWPAFWLTDEDAWPDHGEMDIVEGVNYQSRAKTALHTNAECSMYAHVPDYTKTGTWDRATGIPDTYTGVLDVNTSVPADNCNVLAPHQWANQGCVAVSERNDTLGGNLNRAGGGVYALQWDPENRYIRSWVFPKKQHNGGIPSNLQDAMDSTAAADNGDHDALVAPDPDTWGLPYGYFAIGQGTGCSADHFQNMRIVLNTAFCGTVSGNRFFTDCPAQAKLFNVSSSSSKGDGGAPDPVESCNAWIASDPDEMKEAYWKIRGVYVYERAWEAIPKKNSSTTTATNSPQT